MMTTNASSPLLAKLLSAAGPSAKFTSLITTLKGDERGKGADKKVYGDDRVQVTVVSGFRYDNLLKNNLKKLATVTTQSVIDDAAAKGVALDAATVEVARAELVESFNKSLKGENEATTDHVYETLTVDGEEVRGSRVYKCAKGTGHVCHCRDCTGNARAPKDGTIYLQGLQIFKEVISAAPNGPIPAAKSALKTIAKNFLSANLPKFRYVSYPLEKGKDFIIKVGGTALLESEKNGFLVTDEIVEVLTRNAA